MRENWRQAAIYNNEQTKQDGVSNPDTGQAGSEKEEKGPGDCRVCAGKKNGVSAGAETAEGEIE